MRDNMKRTIICLSLILSTAIAYGQKCVAVNSEKVFKSIEAYNSAMTQLDTESKEYQKKVDAMYNEVQNLYNSYMKQRGNLSENDRKTIEAQIAQKENTAKEYQTAVFGSDGVMMKKRIELIRPIQEKVFGTIEKYATANGIDVVVDVASNASVLFYSKAADHTDQVIALLK